MPETYFQLSKDDLNDVLDAYQKRDIDFLEQLGSWFRWANGPEDFKTFVVSMRKVAEAWEDGEWIQFLTKIEKAIGDTE